ncbi:MAG: phosphohistidine phosphatase SixA [Acidobacteriaceae bacterium]|nr:phosphohistidine phosphatase SixA [Acidobacteriaceae bacterium]MBV9501453.1 phosphohistidine phosphatase SixA [Acidobacteriaceae bacterium]
MQLYLLRHGIAEEGRAGLNDADRSLTADGRRKLRQVLQAAVEAQVKPTLILSSPLKRAVQTAELAKNALGYKDEILQTKALVPGSKVELVWEEIRVHKDQQSLMLVGHNPLFDSLAGYLLGQPGLQLDFKKGAILRIDVESFSAHPKGVLRWYLTPKLAASR